MTVNQVTNASNVQQASQQQTVKMTTQETNQNKYTTVANQPNTTTTQVGTNGASQVVNNSTSNSTPNVNSTSNTNSASSTTPSGTKDANQTAVSQNDSTATSNNVKTIDHEAVSTNINIAASQTSNNQVTNGVTSDNQSNAVARPVSFAATNNQANAPITDKTPAAVDNDHTPVYHASTNQGWSNDVQSITQNNDGTYNIYFLHSVDGAANPFGTSGQNWEHVTTKDWQHFTNQGIAINSHGTDNPNSWKSAWTGSIITNDGNITGVPKGDQVAYFSGLSKKDGSQNIYAAWSDDGGMTFTHALNDGAPVLAYNQAGASGDPNQERDADVVYWNGKMLMYTAEGDKLGVYQSTDGVHWTKADPNGASKVMPGTFAQGINWQSNNVPVECPQIRNLSCDNNGSKIVLFYGAKDPNGKPAQTTGTYAVVGHLDKNGLFAADQDAQRLDLGSDYYGSNLSGNQTLDKPSEDVTGLGWIGNWNYTSAGVYNNQNQHSYPADKSQLENHLGAYSSPRGIFLHYVGGKYHVLSSIDYNLSENSAENKNVSDGQVVGKDADYGNVHEVFNEQTPATQIFDLSLNTKSGKAYQGRVYIKIGQGKDAIVFNYDPDNGMMAVSQNAVELENDMNKDAATNYQKGTTGNGYLVDSDDKALANQPNDLEIYCDKTSIELQFPNGQIYTVARYATDNNQQITIYGQDPNNDNEITLYKQSITPYGQLSNMPGNPTGTTPGTTTKPNIINIKYVDQNDKPCGSFSDASKTAYDKDTIMKLVNDHKPNYGKIVNVSSKTSSDGNDDHINLTTVNVVLDQQVVTKATVNYVDPNGKIVGTFTSSATTDTDKVPTATDIYNQAKAKIPTGYQANADTLKLTGRQLLVDNGLQGASLSYDFPVKVDQATTNEQPSSGNQSVSGPTTNKPSTDNKPAAGDSTNSQPTGGNTITDKPTGSNKPTTDNKPSSGSQSTDGNTATDKPASGSTTDQPSSGSTNDSKLSGNDSSSNQPVGGSTTTDKSSSSSSSSQLAGDSTAADKPASGSTGDGKPATDSKPSNSGDMTDNESGSVAGKPTGGSTDDDKSLSSSTASQPTDVDHEKEETGNGSETPNNSVPTSSANETAGKTGNDLSNGSTTSVGNSVPTSSANETAGKTGNDMSNGSTVSVGNLVPTNSANKTAGKTGNDMSNGSTVSVDNSVPTSSANETVGKTGNDMSNGSTVSVDNSVPTSSANETVGKNGNDMSDGSVTSVGNSVPTSSANETAGKTGNDPSDGSTVSSANDTSSHADGATEGRDGASADTVKPLTLPQTGEKLNDSLLVGTLATLGAVAALKRDKKK